MNTLLIIVAAFVIGLLIFNSTKHKDPEALACAREILAFLEKNPTAKAAQITPILAQYQRTRNDAGQVTKLIRSRLNSIGINKNEREDVMIEIRKAKQLLEQ